MKLEQFNQYIMENSLLDDSVDDLDCFGEFCKEDKICSTYCAYSIRCAIEQSVNPKIDLFDHMLITNSYPAKLQ